MDGKQTIILLVAIAALATGHFAWTDWVRLKEHEHGEETTSRLSEQETERLKLVTDAMQQKPEIRRSQEFISHFKGGLSRRLKRTDQIKIDGQAVITGDRVTEIVPPRRTASQEARLDGEYLINEVKFPERFGGTYRFSVTRMHDSKNLMVDATPEKLTGEQITILKDGGLSVKKVYMEINAKELRGHISAANLVSINWLE